MNNGGDDYGGERVVVVIYGDGGCRIGSCCSGNVGFEGWMGWFIVRMGVEVVFLLKYRL